MKKLFIFLILFLCMCLISVTAFELGIGTVFEGGLYNYTVNTTFELSNATLISAEEFYLDEVEYCLSPYRWNFNTTRECLFYPTNLTMDTGDDGSVDYSNTSFDGEITVDLNITAIQNYIDGCAAFPCEMPINFTSSTAGILEYSDLEIKYYTSLFDTALYLDDLSADRKYEYGTLANISTNFTETCLFSNCSICIDVDDVLQGCADDTYSTNYNHTDDIKITTFNDSTSSKNLTNTTNVTYIDVGNVNIDISSLAINVTGFQNGTYPTDTTLDYDGNTSTAEEILLGQLIGANLYENRFTYSNIEYTSLNLTRSSAGSRIVYVNLSTLGTDNVVNFTMQLDGFDIDAGNNLNFVEEFDNDSLPYIINASTTGAIPYWIPDDMTTNKTTYYSTGTSIYTAWTDNANTRIVSTATIDDSDWDDQCCMAVDNCGQDTDNTATSISLIGQNLSQYKRIQFTWAYASTGSGSYSCGTGEGCQTNGRGTSYINMGMALSNPSYTNAVGLPGISYGFNRGYDWGAYGGATVRLERVEDYPSATYTFDVYKNDVLQGTTTGLSGDIVIAASSSIWQLNFCYGEGGGQATNYISNLEYSGLGNNLTGNNTYDTNSTFTSEIIGNTTNNVSIATLTSISREPSGCDIDYYLSNDNGSTWTITYSDVPLSFPTNGKYIKWKVDLNCSITSDTSSVSEIEINVIPQSITGLKIDIGNDGIYDWNYTETLNSTNSPQIFSEDGTELLKYAESSCADSATCNIPLNFYFPTAGRVQLSDFNITHNPNPISITTSEVEDFNPINLTFGINTGIVQIDDIDLLFKGSKNLTILAYKADDKTFNDTQILQVKYSKFNYSLPTDFDYWEILAYGTTKYNITPEGQTDSQPIWNITSQAYDDSLDLYVWVNESLDSCTNITFTNASTMGNIKINTTPQKIQDSIAISGSQGIWNWVDLVGCSAGAQIPYFWFGGICSSCVLVDDWQNQVTTLTG